MIARRKLASGPAATIAARLATDLWAKDTAFSALVNGLSSPFSSTVDVSSPNIFTYPPRGTRLIFQRVPRRSFQP